MNTAAREHGAAKIGVLGGSFDPVHHGHLLLARAALEELGLDQVLFVPAALSPHKTGTIPATAEDRLRMLELALAGEPGFRIALNELQRPAPSYTVDTLRELRKAHPSAEFHLLIGADNVEKFHTWREADALPALARIAVLDRAAGAPAHAFPVVRRAVDISSTEIRRRASEGKSIRYLTPDPVCDYIQRRGLYRTSDS